MPRASLSESEMRLVAYAWQCLKSEAAIDYPQFAKLGSFGSVNSARARWSKVHLKLKAAVKKYASPARPDQSLEITPSPETPSSSPSGSSTKKRPIEESTPSPSKRPKRSTGKIASCKTPAGVHSDDSNDFVLEPEGLAF
ncbi:hypothetical protein DOTSEDRAFT_33322 [Dothistroma septosporum NZE10]|uniref:Myb-like domain-containing protein n=1 Tax=Dothistroma septosporum (strain NZE10 / CBS 128990) TaxID=675120 RepID=N1PTH0_DOTSN|nr:hypothetical protein DOTSEDRAFT_33322 [Dothistroma septosporum NZE10]